MMLQVFVRGGGGVIESVCISDPGSPDPADYLISTTYINGSWQTEVEAQLEGMHISEVRGGEPVRVLYNSGRGLMAEGLLDRRFTVSPMDSLCRSLLEILSAFFSRPENEGKRHTIIFFGDGGAFVQAVLDHTPYADRVDCIGIAPMTYVIGHPTVYHFRVGGDLLTLRDRYGYNRVRVVTLGYSSGATGLIAPGLRDPSYQYALSIQNFSQLQEGQEVVDPAVAMTLIQMGTNMGSFAESEFLYNDQDNSHERAVHPCPSTLSERTLSGIFLIPSVVGLMQDIFVRSVLTPEDLHFYWVSNTGYCAGLFQRFTLFFTNRRDLRCSWRRVRLTAQALATPILLISTAEFANYLRRIPRDNPWLRSAYVGGAVMSGTWIFLALGNTFLTRLRLRAQRFGLRLMHDPEQIRRGGGRGVVLRVADIGRRGVAEGLPNMFAGVVAGVGAAVLSIASIPSPLLGLREAYLNSTGQPLNRTSVLDLEILRDPAVSWETGDWFGLSSTISLILGILVICTTIRVMISSVRRNRYRRQ